MLWRDRRVFAGLTNRRQAPGAPAARRGLSIRARLLLAATVIPVILACGPVTPLTTLTAAPASRLRLVITIDYVDASATSVPLTISVLIPADVEVGAAEVVFAGHLRLTVNGVRVPEPTTREDMLPPVRRMTMLRQPLGGSYRVVYTDERGQQTTVVIPAPFWDPTITSPAAGALVPIPQPPTPLSNAWLPVMYTPLVFPPDAVPSGTDGYQSSVTVWGRCTQSTQSVCTPCNGHMSLCRIADQGRIFNAPQEFHIQTEQVSVEHSVNVVPGPGEIEVSAHSSWDIPQSGFASVSVSFFDSTYSPITWVAP